MVTSRREFLTKAAAVAAGSAALSHLERPMSNLLESSASPVLAQETEYPANKMSPALPEVITQITLHTPHVIKEIAPGRPFQIWSFEGSAPGPILHVKEGEAVDFTLINDGMTLHSIDFHAAQLAWDRYYQSIPPGESLPFTWTPNFPGVFMYHCGTPPVFVHIGNGMHGAIVVQPRDGWPEAAREYVLVQHEWYVSAEPDDSGVYFGDPAKILAVQPDFVVFNGYFNQYSEEPLVADPGELIRIHVCNSGPTLWSAFHVIGALFEAAYADGNPANRQTGMQTVTIPPGGGYTVELRIPDEGFYPFVTHSFAYTGLGALGLIKIGNPPDLPGMASH